MEEDMGAPMVEGMDEIMEIEMRMAWRVPTVSMESKEES
jgi:hypothetical protein